MNQGQIFKLISSKTNENAQNKMSYNTLNIRYFTDLYKKDEEFRILICC